MSEEGRSGMNFWRGYLIAGRYAPSTVLGCPAKNYMGQTFQASHNAHGASRWVFNHVESDGAGPSFRRNPVYVWYGPGSYNAYNVSAYSGGNLIVPHYPTSRVYDQRNPLMTCPQVWVQSRPVVVV